MTPDPGVPTGPPARAALARKIRQGTRVSEEARGNQEVQDVVEVISPEQLRFTAGISKAMSNGRWKGFNVYPQSLPRITEGFHRWVDSDNEKLFDTYAIEGLNGL